MYRSLRWTRSGESAIAVLSDDDGGWPQDVLADGVAFLGDGDDHAVGSRIQDERRRHSLVKGSVERLAQDVQTSDSESRQLRQKLVAHELDAACESSGSVLRVGGTARGSN